MGQRPMLIIIIIIAMFGGRLLLAKVFDRSTYSGGFYSVKIPEGWELKKEEDEIIFISPDVDPWTDVPEAMFSIYGKKVDGALFLDDFYGLVKESLRRTKGKVLKEGEADFNGIKSKWVLFRNEKPDIAILSFYIVDDYNRLIKVQFATDTKLFQKYRPQFEEFKKTIKFRKYL